MSTHRMTLPFLLAITGCVELGKGDTGAAADDDGPIEFIGAPCETDDDCPYAGGFCLEDEAGLPRGTCSAECSQYCDDADDHPTTFCVDRTALPAKARTKVHTGACVARCNYGIHEEGGCRPDYGCQREPRYREPDRSTWVCLPGEADRDLPRCYQELSDRGVAFEPDVRVPDRTSDGQRCIINDPVWLEREIKGVRLVYEFDMSLDKTLAACELGLALADTVDDLETHDVTAIRHMGTYACRTIGGGSTLSRHAYGDAIDISGFQFRNGERYDLEADWEHDTRSFRTDAGSWLYSTGSRWYSKGLWAIVLTPNYNAAHDDHFHVDLTPGSRYYARMAEGDTTLSEADCGGPSGDPDFRLPTRK